AVFGCGGGDAGADLLGSGGAYAAGVVAAQDMAFVAVDHGAAGGAGLLFDDDSDAFAVALGGGGDELFDGTGWDAHADEVREVEAAGALVEVEPDADGVVGIRGGGAWFGCGEVPEADAVGGGGELAAVDLVEPGSLEEFAVVGDV